MIHEFQSNKIIIIVGGFLNGRYIPLLFNGLGYECIHVAEKRHLESSIIYKNFDPNIYKELFVIDAENDLNNFIKKWVGKVFCVIAGSEPSVQLADYLTHSLGLEGNIFDLSLARRNKYFMHNTLKEHGISYAKQILSENINDILDFFYSSLGKIVLKPPASASTDSVFYCTNEDQVNKSFSHILGRINVVNEMNKSVLAQEYVEGIQYIVNATSSNGTHYITDIWKETRENDDLPSDDLYSDLLERDTDTFVILQNYVFSVLDALGIRIGPSHAEVRIRKDGTPCLIEIASRLSGGIDMSIVHKICGVSSLSLIPDAFLNPTRFLEIVHLPTTKINKHVRHVYLFSDVEGIIKRDIDINNFLELESFSSLSFCFKKGDFLPKTNRAFLKPRPGSAYLINCDQKKLEDDYKRLRFLEKKIYRGLL